MAPYHSFGGMGATDPAADQSVVSSAPSDSVAFCRQATKIQLAQRQSQPSRTHLDALDEEGSDCGASDAASTAASTIDNISFDNAAFFAKYTYSQECALLAQNFHNSCKRIGVFDRLHYQHDTRLISVTLVYVFYKFQIHHCDMALDLALTLCYLEDFMKEPSIDLGQKDALTVVVTLVFLAHSHNADRAIRLKDWFREVLWRALPDVRAANAFVFLVFKNLLHFRTTPRDSKVKKHVQRLCSVSAPSCPTSPSKESKATFHS